MTKTLAGGFRNSEVPVKYVNRYVITAVAEQTQRWKSQFETILNKEAPNNLGDIPIRPVRSSGTSILELGLVTAVLLNSKNIRTELTHIGAKMTTDGNSDSVFKAMINKARVLFAALKNLEVQ